MQNTHQSVGSTLSAAVFAAASANGSQSSSTTAGDADLDLAPPPQPAPNCCRCLAESAEATTAPPAPPSLLRSLPSLASLPGAAVACSTLLRLAEGAAGDGAAGAGEVGAARVAGEGDGERLLYFIVAAFCGCAAAPALTRKSVDQVRVVMSCEACNSK